MRRPNKLWSAALIVCLGAALDTPLFASEAAPADAVAVVSSAPSPSEDASSLARTLTAIKTNDPTVAWDPQIWGPEMTAAANAEAFGQFGRFGRRGRRDNDGARAAIILGAIGAIAGTALLVYANRPE